MGGHDDAYWARRLDEDFGGIPRTCEEFLRTLREYVQEQVGAYHGEPEKPNMPEKPGSWPVEAGAEVEHPSYGVVPVLAVDGATAWCTLDDGTHASLILQNLTVTKPAVPERGDTVRVTGETYPCLVRAKSERGPDMWIIRPPVGAPIHLKRDEFVILAKVPTR